MSELDKFTLEYNVEVKDSVARLDKLNKKVADVKKESDKTKSSLKSFAADAGEEIGKLVPGIDAVSKAIRSMGAEFGLAGAAIAVLGAGIASVMKMRDTYNAQRKQGIDIGVSPIQIEDNERKLVKASRGTVTPAMADAALKRLAEINTEVATDPTGATARNLRLKGLSARGVFDPKGPTTTMDRAQELQTRWRGMSDSKVNAEAKSFGIDPDTARAIKNATDVGKITDHGSDEVASRLKTEESLSKLNDASAKTGENFRELSNQIGERLTPAMIAVSQLMEGFTGGLKGSEGGMEQEQSSVTKVDGFWNRLRAVWRTENGNTDLSDLKKPEQTGAARQKQEKDAQYQAAQIRIQQATMDAQSVAAAQSKAEADKNQATVNMFAAAVTSFSNAVDVNQAIAAWAGTAGRASGLSGPTVPGATNAASTRASKNNNPGNIEYGAFARAQGATASDGRFAVFPNAEAGRAAQQKLIEGYKSKGIDTISGIVNRYAPAADNNNVAAYIADVTKRSGIAADAHLTPAQYRAVSDAMIIHEGGGSGIGQSRDSLNLTSIQNQFASTLGIDAKQVMTGNVNKGDLTRARDIINAGLRNKLASEFNEAHNPNLTEAQSGAAMREAAQQARQIDYLDKYGSQVIAKGREGGRSLTLGATPQGGSFDQLAVQINVNGAGDPQMVAKEINKILSTHINDIHNNASSAIKG